MLGKAQHRKTYWREEIKPKIPLLLLLNVKFTSFWPHQFTIYKLQQGCGVCICLFSCFYPRVNPRYHFFSFSKWEKLGENNKHVQLFRNDNWLDRKIQLIQVSSPRPDCETQEGGWIVADSTFFETTFHILFFLFHIIFFYFIFLFFHFHILIFLMRWHKI